MPTLTQFILVTKKWFQFVENHGQPRALADNQKLQPGCPWDHYFFLNQTLVGNITFLQLFDPIYHPKKELWLSSFKICYCFNYMPDLHFTYKQKVKSGSQTYFVNSYILKSFGKTPPLLLTKYIHMTDKIKCCYRNLSTFY